MFIMTNQYNASRIYKVINPDDCPLSSGGSGALLCNDVKDSPLSTGYVCGLPVIVSRAKTIPRTWKHLLPGLQDTEVRWDKEYEVFVRIFDDDDNWLY